MVRRVVPLDRLQAVADLAPKPEESARSNGHKPETNGRYNGTNRRLIVADYLRHYGIGFEEKDGSGGDKFVLDECPFNPAHKRPDSYVMQYHSGKTIFHCSHNSCSDKIWKDLRSVVGEPQPHHYDPPKTDHKARHEEWEQSQQPETQSHERKKKPSTWYTCEELDKADFTTEYHVEGVLAKMQQAIISGAFKTMKTTTSIDLALSVSAGRPFLGQFFTNKCPVGYFCGESGGATTQETARRVAKEKGMPLSNFNVHWNFDLPIVSDPEDLKQVEDDTKRLGLELVIIDPAYLSMGLSGNEASNVFSVGQKLLPLTRLQEETGCTVVIVHHNKRGVIDPFEPPELADIAWSGFAEWARQWLLLGRRSKYDPEANGGGYHELWMNYGGSAGHTGLWALNISEGTRQDEDGRHWEVEVIKASSARADAAREAQEAKQSKRETEQQVKREKDIEIITQKLTAIGDAGETKSILKDLCGIHSQRFNAAFAEMLEAGTIESVTVKKGNNREYDGYRIASGRTRTHSDKKNPSDCPSANRTQSDNPPIGGCPSD